MPTYRLNLDNGRALDIDAPNLEAALSRAGRSYPGATVVSMGVIASNEPSVDDLAEAETVDEDQE